jgi:hypothetical protein
MGRATFWAIFSKTHLVTLAKSSLVRFENKNISFYFEKRSGLCIQSEVVGSSEILISK